jgi:hypothetical protein
MKYYPKPDWRGFVKNVAGTTVFLALIHAAPYVATWIHATFYGERLEVDSRSFRAVLILAYVMYGVAFVIGASGLAWSWWHNRGADRTD